MHELEDALPRLLPSFLERQRWFGGKDRTIVACDVEDVAHLSRDPDIALVVSGVSYADGGRERYSLLLTILADTRGLPVVGRLRPAGNWIVEAAADAAVSRVLLRGFAAAGVIPTRNGGQLRFGDIGEAAPRLLAQDALPIIPLGTEQSNTSLRVGGAFAFKLFRRLENGENPELEVCRFLTTHTSFRAMPTLEGSLTYLSPRDESSTLGVIEAWIDNEGDGWRYVLAALSDCLRTGSLPPNLVRDMTSLGSTTADLHAALESGVDVDAFAPVPVLQRDIDSWSAAVRDRAARAVTLIESRLESWAAEPRGLGASILARAPFPSSIASPPDLAVTGPFDKIRVHGDYHLGQTLKTPGGFAIIDFEGEPARPLAERRQKLCALKDVAGMLRSIDYAIDTVSEGQSAADWLRSLGVREAFLEGYLHTAVSRGATSIPGNPRAVDAWLTFFELEKTLYELDYELNNRPAWVHIPLRGIRRALDRSTA